MRSLLPLMLLLFVSQAQADARPIVLYLSMDNCPMCQAFEREVLTDAAVDALLDQSFQWLKHRTGQAELGLPNGRRVSENEFLHKLNIYGAPALVYFNSDHEVVLVQQGPQDSRQFLQSMQYVLAAGYETLPFSHWRIQNP